MYPHDRRPGMTRIGRSLTPSWQTLERTAVLVMLAVSTVLLSSAVAQRQRGGEQPSSAQAGAIDEQLPSAALADAIQKGDSSAVLAMIEFADFQCPFCARNALEVHPAIERAWIVPGKVRYVFMHLPLQAIHHDALDAARAAECAGKQNQFWPMHQRLFANPNDLSEGARRRHAEELSLDLDSFSACMATEVDEKIKRDIALASRLGITATPSFLFGKVQPDGSVALTHRLSGAAPYEAFAAILQHLSS